MLLQEGAKQNETKRIEVEKTVELKRVKESQHKKAEKGGIEKEKEAKIEKIEKILLQELEKQKNDEEKIKEVIRLEELTLQKEKKQKDELRIQAAKYQLNCVYNQVNLLVKKHISFWN